MDSSGESGSPSPIPPIPVHHQHHSAEEEEEEEEEWCDDEQEQPRAPTTKRTREEEEEDEEIPSGVEGQYKLCSGCSDILPFQSCTWKPGNI